MRCGHHPLVISAIGADESQSAVRRHLESVSGSDRKWVSGSVLILGSTPIGVLG